MTWDKFVSFFEYGDIERVFVATKAGVANVDLYYIRDKDEFADLILNHKIGLGILCRLYMEEDFPYFKLEDKLVHIKDYDELAELLKPLQAELERAIHAEPSAFRKWMDVVAYLEYDKDEDKLVWDRMKVLEEAFGERKSKQLFTEKEELGNDFTLMKGGFKIENEIHTLCALLKDNATYVPVDFENCIIAPNITSKSDLLGKFFRRTTDDDCETIVVFDINGNERSLGTLADAHKTMQRISIEEGARKIIYIDSNPTNLVFAFSDKPEARYHAVYEKPEDMMAYEVFKLKELRYY
jgi:hypothetical protein